MIARSWDGVTRANEADEYTDYLCRTGVKDLSTTRGNRGVYVFRRREGDRARFRVLSLWDSMEGIRRFAGDDPGRARYYPEDERFLAALDPNVEHFEVVAEGGERRTSGEASALAEELRSLVHGDPWHGECLETLLADVSAETAAARPVPAAHTILELTLHLAAWTDVARRRLDGEVVKQPAGGDFPAPAATDARAWAAARDGLLQAHATLAARVASLSDADLDAGVPGCSYDARFLVHGALHHTVYHSGQIGLLRKTAG
jgi:heme-degrading monooxygenase HmoA